MVVGIEVAVIFAFIGCFLIWKMKKGKKADLNAAEVLVKNIKKNEGGRRESLLQVFGESYDMEGEELDAAVDEFLNRERTFFKTLISVYVDRDASEFSKLATALEEMVKPYSDLALSTELSVDSEALEVLQQENQTLGKELDESKKVMEELLSEYTATFDKEGEGKEPETVQKTDNPVSESNENEPVEESEVEMELTAETFTAEEENEESSVLAEKLTLDDEQSTNTEIEAELIADDQSDDENSSEEIAESATNEVALDELDEELETDVA